jgi:hypothetical protein
MKARQLEDRVIAVIEPWYGKPCRPDSFFNDNENLSGDDGEQMLLQLCKEFSIDPERFFNEFPLNSLFYVEWGSAFLPLVPFFRWKNTKNPPVSLRQYTIAEFSQLLSSRFSLDVP